MQRKDNNDTSRRKRKTEMLCSLCTAMYMYVYSREREGAESEGERLRCFSRETFLKKRRRVSARRRLQRGVGGDGGKEANTEEEKRECRTSHDVS